jgi:hypothetical protein
MMMPCLPVRWPLPPTRDQDLLALNPFRGIAILSAKQALDLIAANAI